MLRCIIFSGQMSQLGQSLPIDLNDYVRFGQQRTWANYQRNVRVQSCIRPSNAAVRPLALM
jgi:hypothetical protein